MNTEFKKLLIELLLHENIVGSWGVSKIKIQQKTISFHVSAFNYKGLIRIKSLQKRYNIIIGDVKITNLELCKIVETIDNIIERTTNYFEDIAKWIDNNQIEIVNI